MLEIQDHLDCSVVLSCERTMDAGNWNWLEFAKLGVGILTPIAIVVAGIYVHRITKRFEHFQWRGQKLIEKRLAIYDEIAPLINDVLCYYTYVGAWRDFDPPQIVALKRTIDRKIHLSAPLFGLEFFNSCMRFQDLCFDTYSGWGEDAKLRTEFRRRQESRPKDWKSEWADYFSDEVTDPKEIRTAYKAVMEAFAQDIGIHSPFSVPPPGRLPINIE